MKITKLLLAMLLVSLSVFISCQKEFSNDETFVVTTDMSPNINTTIQGRITDESNNPVQGALVQAGSTTATTNVNGEFSLNNAYVYDQAAYVKVTKAGYFTGSRTFVAQSNSVHYVEIKLIPSISAGTIASGTGGTVSIANGTSVTLAASSVVVAATNATYTGDISVSIGYIDPTAADLPLQMPGDLRGINASNTEMGLQSFGMVAVELRGASGEKLQVASGKTATVKFAVAASLTATAPATIPLWSFDESNGLWKQEGSATLSGGFYIGSVSHFSFWNCDAQFPTVEFKAIIKNQNGEALKHKLVRIRRTVNTSYSMAFTDSSGVVKGRVPKNEALILEVLVSHNCASAIHTQNIGPFAAATTINVTVTTTSAQVATVSGTATNCTGGNVTSGTAELSLGFRLYRAPVVNGAFHFSNLFLCGSGLAGRLTVIDSTTSQQSSPVNITVNSGANAAGAITACGTSSAQFINYTWNGTSYSLVPPADSLIAYLTMGATLTYVSGFSMNATTPAKQINFAFTGSAVGTGNVTSLTVGNANAYGSLAATAPLSITEYGGPGAYVAGSFSANVRDSINPVTPIQVSFRVKRRQ